MAGTVGVVIWIWSMASRAIYQDWENYVFDHEMRGERTTVAEYLADREEKFVNAARTWWKGAPSPKQAIPPPKAAVPPPPKQQPRIIEENGLVGRLSIPRLHLSAMVREGTQDLTLNVALGHVPGTAMPGQNGNIGVAGHRDTIFRGLKDIHVKDLIQLETPEGNFSYEVESTQIVTPRNVSVLKAGQQPELTLITCYPFYYVGSAPDRFIVKARQLFSEPAMRKARQKPTETAGKASPDDPPLATVGRTHATNAAAKRVAFAVSRDHSRQLAPGISVGLTDTDEVTREVNGWLWVMPDRRTIWLRALHVGEPLIFYGGADGKRRELVITSVARSTMAGYLLVPADRDVTNPSGRSDHRRSESSQLPISRVWQRFDNTPQYETARQRLAQR
jgi:sortase A